MPSSAAHAGGDSAGPGVLDGHGPPLGDRLGVGGDALRPDRGPLLAAGRRRRGPVGGLGQQRHQDPVPQQRDRAAVGVDRLGRAPGDGFQDLRQLEARGDRSGGVEHGLGSAPPPLALVVEARVLEGDRGVVGEGLQEVEVGVRKATVTVGDRQDADQRAVHPQGSGGHRLGPEVGEPRAPLGREVDVGVGEVVVDTERPPFPHDPADQTHPGREDVTGRQQVGPGAGDGQRDQRAIGGQQPQGGHLDVEKCHQALDDAVCHGRRIEGFGEGAGQAGDLLRLAPPALAGGVEARVADGDHGLVDEALQQLLVVVVHAEGLGAVEGQHRDQLAAVGDRQPVEASQPVPPPPVAGDEPLVGENVGDVGRPAVGGDPAEDALIPRHGSERKVSRPARVGRGHQFQTPAVRVGAPEQGQGRGHELRGGPGDLLEDPVRVERGADDLVDPGQGGQPSGPLLGAGVQAGVLDRDGGQVAEGLQDLDLLRRRPTGLAEEQRENSDPAAPGGQRQAEEGHEPFRLDPGPVDDPGVGPDVFDDDRRGRHRGGARQASAQGE